MKEANAKRRKYTARRHNILDIYCLLASFVALVVGPICGVIGVASLAYFLSSLIALNGVVRFLWHGHHRITAAGIYYLSTTVFGGIAGITITRLNSYPVDWYFIGALLIILITDDLLYWRYFRRTSILFKSTRHSIVRSPKSTGGSKQGIVLGVLLFILGVVAVSLNLPLGPMGPVSGYAGASLIAVSSFSGLEKKTLLRHPIRVAVGVFSLVGFSSLFFENSGRLNLVTLGITFYVLFLAYVDVRSAKKIMVSLIIPALLIAGILRNHRNEAITTSSISVEQVTETGDGLGSMTSPLHFFAEVMRADRGKDGALGKLDYPGQTFVEAMTVPIPRAVWANKPVGLGMRLTLWVNPRLARAGHSYAALSYAEWFINFGWLGFIFMLVCIGNLIKWLDRKLAGFYHYPPRDLKGLLAFCALSIAVAGIIDYIWVGLFTFNARAGLRVLLLLALMYGFKFISNRPHKRSHRVNRRA